MQHDIKKVTTKDRYGNQISYEFEAPVKPLDQTAIVKEMMKETADMNGMNFEVPEIEIDGGHPGEPRGSDTVPAWLTPGEFVVNAEAMRIPGAQEIVEDINDQGRAMQQEQGGSIPSYDIGGKVSKLYKEGYTAPGQAYAIAKDMGYQMGGPVPFIAGPRLNEPKYQDDGGWITDELLDKLREVESGGRNDAVSKAGAVGEYQWLPSSAKQAGYGVKAFDPLDPKAARKATAQYLKNMQKYHGFTPEETLRAYNWGPGNVLKHKAGKRKDIPDEALNYAGKILGYDKIEGVPAPEGMPVPTARPEGLGMPEALPTPRPQPEPELSGWQQFANKYLLGDKTKYSMEGGPVYYQAGNIVPEIKPGGHAMFGGTQNLGGGVHPLAKGPEGIIGNDTNIVTDEAPVYEPSFWDKYVLGPATKDERALTDADKGFLDAKTAESEKLAAAQLAEEENQIADEYVPVQDIESDIIEGSGTKEGIGMEVDDFDTKNFKNDVKGKIFNKIDKETKNSEGPGSDQAGENKSEAEIKEAAKTDPGMVEKTTGFLKGIFGDLFDTKELGRMAVMYAGSRVLGYNHQGSLRFAAKQYINRVDQKVANRNEFIKSNAKNYTAASLEAYKKSGDLTSLVPVGAPVNATGEYKTFYDSGKAVKAEKFKVGKSTAWSTDGGKTFLDGSKFKQNPVEVKGTKEWNSRIKDYRNVTTDQLKSLRSQFDKYAVDDDTFYKTDINPSTSAGKIAEWAADNNVAPEKLSGLVESAYHDAINDKRQDGSRARSLVPYLNQLIIRQKVGNPDIFLAKGFDPEDKGAKQYVNAQKLQSLNNSVAHVMKGKGKKGGTQDLANLFYNAALRDWNKLSTKEQEKYIGSALDDESGFYKFVESQAIKYAQ